MRVELPYWLQSGFVFSGAEGDEDGGEQNQDDQNEDDPDNGEKPSTEDEGAKKDPEDVTGLLETLRKERADRKAAERKLKQKDRELAAAQGKDTPDIERLTGERDTYATKVQRLADSFLRTSLNLAIEREAVRAGFSDPEDAVLLVDRTMIDADQDEDEPEKVEINAKSVERAVKALADKKKHLLRPPGSGDGQRTGGQHNGSTKQKTQAERDAELRKRYRHL